MTACAICYSYVIVGDPGSFLPIFSYHVATLAAALILINTLCPDDNLRMLSKKHCLKNGPTVSGGDHAQPRAVLVAAQNRSPSPSSAVTSSPVL